MKQAPEYRIITVEKAILALELLSDMSGANHNLTFIADKLKLSKEKTFRIMRTLVELGIAAKDENRGVYYLDLPAFEFARKLLRPAALITNAHPVMEQLARKHHEDVYLTVLQDKEVLFLDVADGEQQEKSLQLVGKRYPFFNTTAGKVMAAMGVSLDHVSTLLGRGRRNNPAISMDTLDLELAQIRSEGVAVDKDSLGEGIVSISVPFKDYAGKVVGAITLLGPTVRLLADRIETEIIPSLLDGADLLSLKLGYAKH